jgi:hypothetical protein
MTQGSRLLSAKLAQALAQALTGWAVLAHLFGSSEISPFVVFFAVTAVAVPMKRAVGDRAAAVACFSSGLLTSGLVVTEVLTAGFDFVLGGFGGFSIGLFEMLLLAASVLFAFAGAFYWIGQAER